MIPALSALCHCGFLHVSNWSEVAYFSPYHYTPSPTGRGSRALLAGVQSTLVKSSTHLLLCLHLIPPGTDAGHAVVVAFQHLHRLAQPRLRGLDAELARLFALLRRHPFAV